MRNQNSQDNQGHSETSAALYWIVAATADCLCCVACVLIYVVYSLVFMLIKMGVWILGVASLMLHLTVQSDNSREMSLAAQSKLWYHKGGGGR